MNQVLGKSAGHILEMSECIDFLKNQEKPTGQRFWPKTLGEKPGGHRF